MCSICFNHFRFNSQHILSQRVGGGGYMVSLEELNFHCENE